MSSENPIDLRQDRRQWLKTSATMIGASLLPASTVAAAEPQAEVKPAAPPAAREGQQAGSAAHFFTPAQHAMVEELTETIIPADSHSGGAKAAKVADTIDRHLALTYDDSERSLWREGLRLVDIMSQHYNGKTFVDASPAERIAVLTVLSENSRMNDLPEVKFFNQLKGATVACYYTSKIGIHDELQYKGNRILKEYVGCDDQDAAKT
jgi:hypothetical protein